MSVCVSGDDCAVGVICCLNLTNCDCVCCLGMTSPEGERVPFVRPVDPKNKNIEAWMVEVKDAMLDAIRLMRSS